MNTPLRRGEPRTRLKLVHRALIGGGVVLLVRLSVLQGVRGLAYRAAIRPQRIILEPTHGSIVDRNGVILAQSLYDGTLAFDPSVVLARPKKPVEARRFDARLLASAYRVASIAHMTPIEVQQAMDAAYRSAAAYRTAAKHQELRFVPIRRHLSINQRQEIETSRPRLLGFGVVDGTVRTYSLGPDAAQVVGWIDGQHRPVLGLEETERSVLDGRAGMCLAYTDPRGDEIPGTRRAFTPMVQGENVQTTLDARIQRAAAAAASRVYSEYHPKGVAVIVLAPTTGSVLGLADMPTFDPNSTAPSARTQSEMRERATCQLIEPGSVMKPLTMAAAWDAGAVNASSRFLCTGVTEIGGRALHCVLEGARFAHGHGLLSCAGIVTYSCNIGAAHVALLLGGRKLDQDFRAFGLYQNAGLGLPYEATGFWSLVPKDPQPYAPVKVARAAFGQSVVITPFALIRGFSTIANDGVAMRSRIVRALTDLNGQVVRRFPPVTEGRVISSSTADAIRQMMVDVITRGTGRAASVYGYICAGKTGTANKYHAGQYISSFGGFLPAGPHSTPRAAIYVMVDEPQGAHFGAEVAAPAWQQLASQVMTILNVPRDDPDGSQFRAAHGGSAPPSDAALAQSSPAEHNLPTDSAG
ncbi:MAG: penicillin-binding protein 2 [Armatimonadetes bacterium]|nr:penicillin-binding protein 2 [Armatimonadota bacterium]MDE2205213.1 penicillin-binding protein 2 [Armatimonadota bacterium]